MRYAHRAGFRLGLSVTPPFVWLSQRTACADRFSLSLPDHARWREPVLDRVRHETWFFAVVGLVAPFFLLLKQTTVLVVL